MFLASKKLQSTFVCGQHTSLSSPLGYEEHYPCELLGQSSTINVEFFFMLLKNSVWRSINKKKKQGDVT